MLDQLKGLVLCLAITLVLSVSLPVFAAAEPEVSAASAILMDRKSGRVLWEKEPGRCLSIASTTKIMTAIIALEYGCEADRVIVSEEAAATEGSSIWLDEGEEKTLRELIYGLMLRSGNDAAVAIAEHIADSVDNFCLLMNHKAREIGAVNTWFSNPHGLAHDLHYSTAYDLALISCYALQNERFREIISTPEYTISWPGHPWDRIMSNQNRLLEIYPGGDGVKTGWTQTAGRCFVGSATREGWQLVAVVLNAPQMWEDATLLLDYGFDTFKSEEILYRGQVVCSADVAKGDGKVAVVVAGEFHYPLLPGERSAVRFKFKLAEEIRAPVPAGKKLGELEMYLREQYIGKVDLHSGYPVRKIPLGIHLLRLWESFCR